MLGHLQEQTVLKSLNDRLHTALGSSGSRHWEELFNTIPDGVAISDARGTLTLVNNTFLTITGRASAETTVGEKILEVLSSTNSNNANVAPLLDKLQNGPRNMTCEFHLEMTLPMEFGRIQRIPIVGHKESLATRSECYAM